MIPNQNQNRLLCWHKRMNLNSLPMQDTRGKREQVVARTYKLHLLLLLLLAWIIRLHIQLSFIMIRMTLLTFTLLASLPVAFSPYKRQKMLSAIQNQNNKYLSNNIFFNTCLFRIPSFCTLYCLSLIFWLWGFSFFFFELVIMIHGAENYRHYSNANKMCNILNSL